MAGGDPGNYAGRPTEGTYTTGYPLGNPATEIDWNSFIHTSTWDGDDDTGLEYLAQSVLTNVPQPTGADVKAAWMAHVPAGTYYIANKQARWLMGYGLTPPQTGSINYNMHWYAIDSQITTESLGSAAPGMRQQAADLAGLFGSTTNDGYAVHAAQFYAAMYADAAVDSDVESVVAKGLEVVPVTSRTHQVIQDVLDWYHADEADGTLDWRATHQLLFNKYVCAQSMGRYRDWIESTVNAGLTTLALLYGQSTDAQGHRAPDFKQTVSIGVLGGFDADCNPATAGGLVGMMLGYSGLPTDLTSQASDHYLVSTLVGLPVDTTVSAVAAGWQSVAEQRIVAAGGTITGVGADRTYHLPEADLVTPPPEKPDPTGPAGLVAAVRAAGGTAWASASVERHVATNDRQNLDTIIDGITDVSYDGHLPYTTRDGVTQQPAGGDWYQVNFDRSVGFRSVTFYEGDITWHFPNNDPRVDTPLGGYFTDLTVEVLDKGAYSPVSGLSFSEPLDAMKFFQQIPAELRPGDRPGHPHPRDGRRDGAVYQHRGAGGRRHAAAPRRHELGRQRQRRRLRHPGRELHRHRRNRQDVVPRGFRPRRRRGRRRFRRAGRPLHRHAGQPVRRARRAGAGRGVAAAGRLGVRPPRPAAQRYISSRLTRLFYRTACVPQHRSEARARVARPAPGQRRRRRRVGRRNAPVAPDPGRRGSES